MFRTELKITPSPLLDHRSSILTIGSCFSDNIGHKLSHHKFNVLINPLGTVYNPISIHNGIKLAATNGDPLKELYTESQGTTKHFSFHSKYSDITVGGLSEKISIALKNVNKFLQTTDVIVVTYGTSWVYNHIGTDLIVANCHKRPSREFNKLLLRSEVIVEDFTGFSKTIRSINPKVKFILTLSPVRHIKDTLELNQVSKSVLRSAIYNIQLKYPDVFYFPAYEIMLDDLRDYRFYDADMIHPSPVAIDYLWDKFSETFFTKETMASNEKWLKISMSLGHKPFQPDSDQHQQHLKRTLAELIELKDRMNVSEEIISIENQLSISRK